MFSSRPPFSDDPEPYTHLTRGGRTSSSHGGTGYFRNVYEPRKKCDRPQHNPANGVLVLFRKQRGPWAPLHAHIDGFLNGIRRLAGDFTIAEIEHADRVLRRLRTMIRHAAIEELLALDYDATDKEN